jgi:hypothetical protein
VSKYPLQKVGPQHHHFEMEEVHAPTAIERVVLVIGSPDDTPAWKSLFSNVTLEDPAIRLRAICGEWSDLFLTSYPNVDPSKRLQVSMKSESSCFASFVLIRKLCRGLDAVRDDHRNKLFAIMHSGVPCVNSAHSVYNCLDRIPCHAALAELAQMHGKDVFPLIDQYYYASYQTMRFTPDFPLVVKVGHAEAGNLHGAFQLFVCTLLIMIFARIWENAV